MARKVTDRMRMATMDEAAKANMTILEYIKDPRMALRLSMVTLEDDEEDILDEVQKKQHDEDSFISLPDLSIGEDMEGTIDVGSKTGFPQGSDTIAHSGAGLPHAAATWQTAGLEVITAQAGGFPG